MRRARDRTPTRCRDGALHIPGESGWRFAAVRRATRGFLLSTLTLFTVLWAGALSVPVLVTIRRRPASRLYAANDGPVQRLRSGDAVNKSVIRGQPSSLKPREGNARTRERGGTLDPSDAQPRRGPRVPLGRGVRGARRRAPRYRATALRRAPRAVRQRGSGWTLVGRRLPRCAPGRHGQRRAAGAPACRAPPAPPSAPSAAWRGRAVAASAVYYSVLRF